jgi:hypothetical protein
VIFSIYCFFARAVSRPLAGVLFLMYRALSGSLQQPHTVYLFLPLSILFIPLRKEEEAPSVPALPPSLGPLRPAQSS